MLARTTLQVETLRAIIEDCSDEDEEQSKNHADQQQHHHNVQIGFSIAASVHPHASPGTQCDGVPQSISDHSSSAANREQDIVAALDSCVQEMAAMFPYRKPVE